MHGTQWPLAARSSNLFQHLVFKIKIHLESIFSCWSYLPASQPTNNLPTYLTINQCTYLPTHLPTNLPTYLLTNLPLDQPTYLFTYLLAQLCKHLFSPRARRWVWCFAHFVSKPVMPLKSYLLKSFIRNNSSFTLQQCGLTYIHIIYIYTYIITRFTSLQNLNEYKIYIFMIVLSKTLLSQIKKQIQLFITRWAWNLIIVGLFSWKFECQHSEVVSGHSLGTRQSTAKSLLFYSKLLQL